MAGILIWQMCSSGDIDGVEAAIARGEDPNTRGGRRNSTCLMEAIHEGPREVAEILLHQAYLDINCVDTTCRTALHYACESSEYPVEEDRGGIECKRSVWDDSIYVCLAKRKGLRLQP